MECLEQLDTLIEQKYGRMVLKNKNMLLEKDLEKAKKIAIATGTVAVGAVVKASIAAGRAGTSALVGTPCGTGTPALVGTAGGTGTAALASAAGGVGAAGAVGALGLAAAAIAAVLLASSASKK